MMMFKNLLSVVAFATIANASPTSYGENVFSSGSGAQTCNTWAQNGQCGNNRDTQLCAYPGAFQQLQLQQQQQQVQQQQLQQLQLQQLQQRQQSQRPVAWVPCVLVCCRNEQDTRDAILIQRGRETLRGLVVQMRKTVNEFKEQAKSLNVNANMAISTLNTLKDVMGDAVTYDTYYHRIRTMVFVSESNIEQTEADINALAEFIKPTTQMDFNFIQKQMNTISQRFTYLMENKKTMPDVIASDCYAISIHFYLLLINPLWIYWEDMRNW
eukprot:Pgem_evm2s20316